MRDKMIKVITNAKQKTVGGSCTSDDLAWFEPELMKWSKEYNKDPERVLDVMLEKGCDLYTACSR